VGHGIGYRIYIYFNAGVGILAAANGEPYDSNFARRDAAPAAAKLSK
jgi:hypothetical protein